MILIDYNQVSLAAILTFRQDLQKSPEEVRNLIRHITLSNILNYKKKYGAEYGEVVICCDGRKYWRREVFPHYKGDRKKSREKSDFDWKLIFFSPLTGPLDTTPNKFAKVITSHGK